MYVLRLWSVSWPRYLSTEKFSNWKCHWVLQRILYLPQIGWWLGPRAPNTESIPLFCIYNWRTANYIASARRSGSPVISQEVTNSLLLPSVIRIIFAPLQHCRKISQLVGPEQVPDQEKWALDSESFESSKVLMSNATHFFYCNSFEHGGKNQEIFLCLF